MSNKAFSKRLTHRLRRRAGDTHEVAARLAPPEELARSHQSKSPVTAQENGAIIVGGEDSNLAKEVIEIERRKKLLGLDPVVIVIVGLLLAFIAFLAWQVSQMPTPE